MWDLTTVFFVVCSIGSEYFFPGHLGWGRLLKSFSNFTELLLFLQQLKLWVLLFWNSLVLIPFSHWYRPAFWIPILLNFDSTSRRFSVWSSILGKNLLDLFWEFTGCTAPDHSLPSVVGRLHIPDSQEGKSFPVSTAVLKLAHCTFQQILLALWGLSCPHSVRQYPTASLFSLLPRFYYREDLWLLLVPPNPVYILKLCEYSII